MVGYLDDNKAPDLLLKAWDSIRGDYPDWRVSFLGNGEVERFQRMAKEMGLLDTVEFTGYVMGDKKKEYFDTASIYCLCSYHEGFPMAVLEAWEHCIAVVTTPVGGLPDVIDEEKNALTFDFGDWLGLAKQLRTLMDDESLRKNMADYAYEFVEEKFSAQNGDEKFRRLYALCTIKK
jgi:glycosyltransferase involved in cell wall biosynthesis